jgi:chromate transporter
VRSFLFGVGAGSLGHLAWVFLKIGCVFFGGGFLLVPLLHHELVTGRGWLTQTQFIDGVAISQLTPGPVALLATVCGYHRGGAAGAVLATVCVFLPAFAVMVALTRLYERARQMEQVRKVLDGFVPAIVGLLVATAADLGRTTAITPWHVGLGALALVAMVRFSVSPALLILAGAIAGLLIGK